MEFKHFTWRVGQRAALIVLSMAILAFASFNDGYHGLTLLMLLLLTVQGIGFFRYVSKTNDELVRFLEAAKYADFSQRFELKHLGAGFEQLGDTFSTILAKLQQVRQGQEQELKHLKAMVEHVPVPLLSLHKNGDVTLWNNSARRFFGHHVVKRLDDIAALDNELATQLSGVLPGVRPLFNVEIDSMPYQLTLSATQLVIAGEQEMLISLQNIKSELDKAQLEAWQSLVRVLTHEIMNSITPVSSLASTAATLVDDAKSQSQGEVAESLQDAHDAVTTVANRSEALMAFVSHYRRLTTLPEPSKKSVAVSQHFAQLERLVRAQWQNPNTQLTISVTPSSLQQEFDEQMLEQSLINLLINAEQASCGQDIPRIELSAYLNTRGHTVIEVNDNGTGVEPEIVEKIFVPFFTTKKEGSGVGLALTRQVMIAHGGSVKLEASKLGGARFILTF